MGFAEERKLKIKMT